MKKNIGATYSAWSIGLEFIVKNIKGESTEAILVILSGSVVYIILNVANINTISALQEAEYSLILVTFYSVLDVTYMYVRQDSYKQMPTVHSRTFEFINSIGSYISRREKHKEHA